MRALLKGLTTEEKAALNYRWEFWARPDQLEPEGNWWTVWLALAGRGWGKTRCGAEWVRQIKNEVGRIGLIAPTAADARDVMVEGESGIMAISPPWDRPLFEPSKRRLTWDNGAMATLYSADEPDRLRGPQHAALWCDELAAWKYMQEAWDMAMFGLRLGNRPKVCATTTPRPLPLIRELLKSETTVVSRGRTYDNLQNLAPAFRQAVLAKYEGTRLGRQELNAEVLDDVPGALWTRQTIEDALWRGDLPDMKRIVVAVDPSGSSGADSEKADSIGIIVAGLGVDGLAYVLADRTCDLSPAGWGKRTVDAYHEFSADRVVAERNYGGAMVEHVIRTVDKKVSYKEVVASRGKAIRAEPVAALYEQGSVRHVGGLDELEDQMCVMTGEGYMGDGSPDRLDAAVWALSDLMLGEHSRYTLENL